MRTNKKGFTLIELLAVIVILAIIALITVPVVINIINNAKKGAAEDSTYGVMEAAKLFWVQNNVENTETTVTLTYDENAKIWKTSDNKELLISGSKPTAGEDASIKVVSGKAEIKNIVFGAFTCNTEENSEKVTCTDAD